MTHMITAIAFPGTTITGNAARTSLKFIQYLALLLTFCFFALISPAQPKGSIPDPANTCGQGSRVRTTQSTNPDSFIPETKTEFFDKNDVLREERIKTKDLDGRDVTITKRYDERGTLKTRDEVRRDDIGVVYDEHQEYDDSGKIIRGRKNIWEKMRWHIFKYDPQTEGYKLVSNSNAEIKKKDQCNCSKTELKLGYSYMRTANEGTLGTLPTGAEISINQRLGDHFGIIIDVTGHQKKLPSLTLNMLGLQGGIQYDFKKCDDDDRVSIFSRIAIGMMHERRITKGPASSATAASGTAGLGADIRIFRKVSVYLGADWVPTYFNKTLQNNFQAGAGLTFKFGSK